MDNEPSELIANVARATKQELMDSYRALLKKYRTLTGEQATAETTNQKQTLQELNQYQKPGDISQTLNQTRLALNATLQEVENKISEKFAELKGFEEAIAGQKTKVQELYEIEETAGALLALLEARAEAQRQAALEKEALEQKRKRDEEEYRFNFELQKRKDKEIYEAEKRKLEAELKARENLQVEKEKVFAAKEAEFENLKEQVAEFPQRLEAEKQALEKRLLAEAQKEKETALMLLQKEMEAQKTVAESRIQNLETLIEEQKTNLHRFEEQLKAAQSQVQEVVIKSIEGHSATKALDAVNKFALEQARASATQK